MKYTRREDGACYRESMNRLLLAVSAVLLLSACGEEEPAPTVPVSIVLVNGNSSARTLVPEVEVTGVRRVLLPAQPLVPGARAELAPLEVPAGEPVAVIVTDEATGAFGRAAVPTATASTCTATARDDRGYQEVDVRCK